MIWTSLIAQGKRQMWMSLFVATLVAAIYFHFARFYQGSGTFLIFAPGWVAIALFWVRAAGRLLSHLRRHPFSRLDLGLANDQVAPGRAFTIEIQGVARRAVRVSRLSAELRCQRRRSADRDRRGELLVSETQVVDENIDWEPQTSRTFRASLPVEADAPFSFRSMEGRISWSIHVAMTVDDWGEMKDELEVTVAPG